MSFKNQVLTGIHFVWLWPSAKKSQQNEHPELILVC